MSKTINNLKRIDHFVFKPFYDQYWKTLAEEINGSDTLLDLGCGTNSPIFNFKHKLKYTLGVDIFEPSLLQSKKNDIHSNYVRLDVLDLGKAIKSKSFDCVLASDLLEHLPREEGLRFISVIEKIAKRKVIIFTPNGFIPQSDYNGNQYQRHLSGWDLKEMRGLGYRVIGINGWKRFFGVNGERAEVVWRPKVFWEKISLLSQILTHQHPKYAFQIFCVREI